MIDLNFAEEVPHALRDLIAHHGRRLGVPLADLERVGQSLDLAEGFVIAAERGVGLEFASGTLVDAVGRRIPAPGIDAHLDCQPVRA